MPAKFQGSDCPPTEPETSEDKCFVYPNRGRSRYPVTVSCKVCIQFGRNPRGRKLEENQTWRDGVVFHCKSNENKRKKAHMNSAAHKEAEKQYIEVEELNVKKGHPSHKDLQMCTENAMVAGMFMVCRNLSHRMYPDLCAFLPLITPETAMLPLGNLHMCHSSLRSIHEANFESVIECLQRPLSATKASPQVMISADKGTAPKDVTRQVTVATIIGCDGMPKEHVLRAPSVAKGDASSTADNIKSTASQFVDLKKIAYVATDSAAYHVGRHKGAIERMSNDSSYGKLIGLPHFCHKMERLVDVCMPA